MMSDQSLEKRKNEWRIACKEKRAMLGKDEKNTVDLAIAQKLFSSSFYVDSKQILLYAAVGGEISTLPIYLRAVSDGKRVLFPRCTGPGIMKFFYSETYPSCPGAFGIPEPNGTEPYSFLPGDLCILPGLAFSEKGARLGYGKGFYDRFLSFFSGKSVGLCHSAFLFRQIPEGEFDRRADAVITEKEIFTAVL